MFKAKITPTRWTIDPFTEKPDVLFIFQTDKSQDVLKITNPSEQLKNNIKYLRAFPDVYEVYKAARAHILSKSKKEDPKTLEKLTESVSRVDIRHSNG